MLITTIFLQYQYHFITVSIFPFSKESLTSFLDFILSLFHHIEGIFKTQLKPITNLCCRQHHTFSSQSQPFPSSSIFNLKPPLLLNKFIIPFPSNMTRPFKTSLSNNFNNHFVQPQSN